MSITVSTLVQDAMFAAGVLGQDGTTQPEGDADQQLVLRFLNRMIDAWSTETMMVYTTLQETLNLVANTATYSTSLFVSGNGRPVAVQGLFVRYAGVDYPIDMIDKSTYDSIGIKTVAAIPQYCYYDPSMPQGTLSLYPVPYATMVAYVDCMRPLTGALTLASTVSLPPGYDSALVDCLAEVICRPFGMPVTPDIARAAKEARARIKRRNIVYVEMESPFQGDNSYDLSYICYPW